MPPDETLEQILSKRFDPADFAGQTVAVAVPDLTRPIDYEELLPPLLSRLEGVADEVTVVVALGLHRPLTDDEIAPLARLADRHGARVAQHDADADDLVELDPDVAADRSGWPRLPARFDRAIAEADEVICVGAVEPHQYAGFSGGAKTVAIGCASHATISAMHGLEFLRDERTALGNIDDNPFQAALWELIAPLRPLWGVMYVPQGTVHGRDQAGMYGTQGTVHEGDQGGMYGTQGTVHGGSYTRYGRLEEAFEACVSVAAKTYFRAVEEPYDWLHLPVEGPKAANFYQASRAATYAALVDRPAVRRGGLIAVEAACPEGLGEGAGERACAEAMRRGKAALLAELEGRRAASTSGGQQRAYVLARALEHCDIALVGAEPIDALAPMGIEQFDTLEAALEAHAPGGAGMTLEDVFHNVPRTTA